MPRMFAENKEPAQYKLSTSTNMVFMSIIFNKLK